MIIETSVVQCVFSFRQSNDYTSGKTFDKCDRIPDPKVSSLKKYAYRVPDYLKGDLRCGDTVLVHCRTGYQLCMIVEINAITTFDPETLAPVVCKCDLSSYWNSIDKAEQLGAMRKQLIKEKKRLESMITFEMLAEKHPEFKEMLDAFIKAGGTF